MKSGPNIGSLASLIGDRARADILTALMAGKALTATELAESAGVTRQTASTHLAKLLDRKLLVLDKQGRHRYFRLADEDVAQMVESLMGVAQRLGIVRLQTGPSEPALRRARVCYDHLAGEVGVQVFDSMRQQRLLEVIGEGVDLTSSGEEFMRSIDIDVDVLVKAKRPMCRTCLDWSERRYHLAGSLGAALLDCFFKRGWAKRNGQSRTVTIAPAGARALRQHFPLRSAA
jgi:DNA-binding transcriptional ArsR family regulator